VLLAWLLLLLCWLMLLLQAGQPAQPYYKSGTSVQRGFDGCGIAWELQQASTVRC